MLQVSYEKIKRTDKGITYSDKIKNEAYINKDVPSIARDSKSYSISAAESRVNQKGDHLTSHTIKSTGALAFIPIESADTEPVKNGEKFLLHPVAKRNSGPKIGSKSESDFIQNESEVIQDGRYSADSKVSQRTSELPFQSIPSYPVLKIITPKHDTPKDSFKAIEGSTYVESKYKRTKLEPISRVGQKKKHDQVLEILSTKERPKTRPESIIPTSQQKARNTGSGPTVTLSGRITPLATDSVTDELEVSKLQILKSSHIFGPSLFFGKAELGTATMMLEDFLRLKETIISESVPILDSTQSKILGWDGEFMIVKLTLQIGSKKILSKKCDLADFERYGEYDQLVLVQIIGVDHLPQLNRYGVCNIRVSLSLGKEIRDFEVGPMHQQSMMTCVLPVPVSNSIENQTIVLTVLHEDLESSEVMEDFLRVCKVSNNSPLTICFQQFHQSFQR